MASRGSAQRLNWLARALGQSHTRPHFSCHLQTGSNGCAWPLHLLAWTGWQRSNGAVPQFCRLGEDAEPKADFDILLETAHVARASSWKGRVGERERERQGKRGQALPTFHFRTLIPASCRQQSKRLSGYASCALSVSLTSSPMGCVRDAPALSAPKFSRDGFCGLTGRMPAIQLAAFNSSKISKKVGLSLPRI